MKKYLSLLLAICLMVVMTPAMAFADGDLLTTAAPVDSAV